MVSNVLLDDNMEAIGFKDPETGEKFYKQSHVDELEEKLRNLSAFVTDFQMFAHAEIVCRKPRKYYTFQDMRKAAYEMAKKKGEVIWGDEIYEDEKFKGLDSIKDYLDEAVNLMLEMDPKCIKAGMFRKKLRNAGVIDD